MVPAALAYIFDQLFGFLQLQTERAVVIGLPQCIDNMVSMHSRSMPLCLNKICQLSFIF